MIGAYGVCGPTSQQDDEISEYARNESRLVEGPRTR